MKTPLRRKHIVTLEQTGASCTAAKGLKRSPGTTTQRQHQPLGKICKTAVQNPSSALTPLSRHLLLSTPLLPYPIPLPQLLVPRSFSLFLFLFPRSFSLFLSPYPITISSFLLHIHFPIPLPQLLFPRSFSLFLYPFPYYSSPVPSLFSSSSPLPTNLPSTNSTPSSCLSPFPYSPPFPSPPLPPSHPLSHQASLEISEGEEKACRQAQQA